MKIRKRPADAVVGNRQLSARVLGLPYDRFWVETRTSASKAFRLRRSGERSYIRAALDKGEAFAILGNLPALVEPNSPCDPHG